MKRSTPITYNDVANVCELLKSAGVKVTNKAVLAILDRGSLTTINKHILKWIEQDKPEALKLSTSIIRSIEEQMGVLLAEHLAPCKEDVERLQAKVVELEGELEKCATALVKKEKEVEELSLGLRETANERDELAGLREQLERQLNEERVLASKAQTGVERLTDEVARLQGELKRERDKGEALQEKYRTASMDAKGKESEISKLAEELVRERKEGERIVAELKEMSQKHERSEAALREEMVGRAKLQTTNDALIAEAAALKRNVAEQASRNDSLQELYRTASLEAKANESKVEILTLQLKGLQPKSQKKNKGEE